MGQTVFGNQDIKFSKAFLFGTGADGIVDSVPFAELQEITVKVTQGLKEMMGPEQLTPVAVGISERKVTGTAKSGRFRARAISMMTGGAAPTTSGGFTTLNGGVNDKPTSFRMHLMSPIDGTDFEMILYVCVATDFSLPFKLNDFVYPDFNFNVYGDSATGLLYKIITPGDQTTS